jgi:hypothetical protein
MFCVYHGRTTSTGDERVVFIDRIRILEDGTVVVDGPNEDLQADPRGMKASMLNKELVN